MGLFNIGPIADEYSDTIRAISSSERKAILVFVLFPLTFGVVFVLLGWLVGGDFAVAIISMLAILIGFSINAGVLLLEQNPADLGAEEGQEEDKKRFLKNTKVLIIYAILVGLVLVLISAVSLIGTSNSVLNEGILHRLISVIIYSGILHYVLTLLLIPARMHTIATLKS